MPHSVYKYFIVLTLNKQIGLNFIFELSEALVAKQFLLNNP